MAYYFVAIMEAKEGGYVLQFPDILEAFSQGDTLEEAYDMAACVLMEAVTEYARTRKSLPEPSTYSQAYVWATREIARDKGLRKDKDPIIQAFKVPSADTTPVRVTVSFAKNALDEIDEKAQRLGMPRSKFLALAAQEYNA